MDQEQVLQMEVELAALKRIQAEARHWLRAMPVDQQSVAYVVWAEKAYFIAVRLAGVGLSEATSDVGKALDDAGVPK